MLHAFDLHHPPLSIAASTARGLLERYPRRLAFAGQAGAGKTTLCLLLSGQLPALAKDPLFRPVPALPIYNHADHMKEEVLEWVARARNRALIPEEAATFDDFCHYLGLSPALVKMDMWPVLGETWEAMQALLTQVYDDRIPVQRFAAIPTGEGLDAKVQFVDDHKTLFRTALQRYGQAIKDISANPAYWAEQTINRSLHQRIVLNGDTRFPEEVDVLRGAGWTIVYLQIDEQTQCARRPGLTPEQKNHVSETSIGPELCDLTIDARQDLGKVALDLADALTARSVAKMTRSVPRPRRAS